ncbi:hypothetical protein Tco_0935701 [Tanacetum coccineum]
MNLRGHVLDKTLADKMRGKIFYIMERWGKVKERPIGHKGHVLSCNSVGLNEMVPVAVGGGVGGDNRWAAGPRNEFRSGYSGRGSSGWNNNRVSQTLKTHTSSAAPKGTSSDVRGTSSSCGKHKPQPQLDSYGFQMQRASDARNVTTRCSTDFRLNKYTL